MFQLGELASANTELNDEQEIVPDSGPSLIGYKVTPSIHKKLAMVVRSGKRFSHKVLESECED